jgi:hypothetical protein
MVKCGSENRYPKDICLKEIGLCAHNMIAILTQQSTKLRGGEYLHAHLMSARVFMLTMNKILIQAPKIMRKVGVWPRFGFVDHLVLNACFNRRGNGLVGKK